MKSSVRIAESLLSAIHLDLSRSHPFAGERVGFMTCDIAARSHIGFSLIARAWHPVADEDYLSDSTVGATIGPAAFRKILERIYGIPQSLFHVHRHEHRGSPRFSPIDARSMRDFVPGFFNACRDRPHGAIVLSLDSAFGCIWESGNGPIQTLEQLQVEP
jgi:hypothetical protein